MNRGVIKVILCPCTDLSNKHRGLKESLVTYIDKAQEAMVTHKQLETDMHKVESWVKEADVACAKPVQLDCSLDMLNIQVKKYRVSHHYRVWKSKLRESLNLKKIFSCCHLEFLYSCKLQQTFFYLNLNPQLEIHPENHIILY